MENVSQLHYSLDISSAFIVVFMEMSSKMYVSVSQEGRLIQTPPSMRV